MKYELRRADDWHEAQGLSAMGWRLVSVTAIGYTDYFYFQRQVRDADHDCHASSEDGCEGCAACVPQREEAA